MTTAGTGAKRAKNPGSGRPPVSPETRARVIELIRSGMGRNATARETGISAGQVSTIAKAEGLTFDRAPLKAQTEARMIDLKAKRAEIALQAAEEVQRLFGLLTAEHEVTHWDKDGIFHSATIPKPTSGDVRNYATAIGILTDKHLVLVRHDSDERDIPAVEKWLQAMMGAGETAA
jgi:transposase-like protein